MIMSSPALALAPQLKALPPDWPGGFWWHWLVFTVIIIAFALSMVMGLTSR